MPHKKMLLAQRRHRWAIVFFLCEYELRDDTRNTREEKEISMKQIHSSSVRSSGAVEANATAHFLSKYRTAAAAQCRPPRPN